MELNVHEMKVMVADVYDIVTKKELGLHLFKHYVLQT
jgi:hypothetical protein